MYGPPLCCQGFCLSARLRCMCPRCCCCCAGDPDRGYQQLITEQLPLRSSQLYDTYGSKGAIPLIPGE